MQYQDLKKYLSAINYIVGEQSINKEKISNEVVSEYYSKSAFYYKKFHSAEGAMHLPIATTENATHKKKLLYQAESINKIIHTQGYSNILELGCGMGFNSHYLAQQNPGKKFTAIDLTPNNIKLAREKTKDLKNITFLQRDFDQLNLPEEKYDLIFAIETLCHSKNVVDLLLNVSSKLKKNGRIIIFDGYVKPNAPNLTREFDKKAYQLLTWGFAVDSFQKLDEVLNAEQLQLINFDNPKEYTKNILSNYTAFQKGAKNALQFPLLLKMLLKSRIISLTFIKQLSAGLFGPYLIHQGYIGYYKLELTQKE